MSDMLAAFEINAAELTEALAEPVMADLMRRGILIETSAKQHASGRPGPNVRTGRLRASITTVPGRDLEGPYVDVGTNVFYAPFVELGTSKAPPYPYLRPALDAGRD